jgi:hypothetical protein
MKVSFDSNINNKQNGDIEFYRGSNGHVDRIGILSSEAHVEYNHYKEAEGKGSYYKCLSKRDNEGKVTEKSICCEHCGEATPRFGLPIVQYSTKADGEFKRPLSWEVKVWIFNLEKWGQLKSINKKWGSLTSKDVEVTCVEEKYQRLTIQPFPEAVWSKDEGLKKDILSRAEEIDQVIPKFMGRNASVDDWRKLLDLVTEPGSGGTVSSSVDLDSLLNGD